MSQWGILVPIAIFTVGPVTWAFNNWVRVRHGYEPERWKSRRERRQDPAEPAPQVAQLSQENERLHGKVSQLEERLRVLERIATDPAERTARAIDALR